MTGKYRKSIFGVTAIMVSIAIFLFVIVTVLSFFYFFKFQITLVIKDQYLWNKIQEVPLDLLSMNLDGERFVCRINKVYYLGGDEEKKQLREQIEGNISKQLFYFLEGAQYPLKAVIYIGEIKITKYLEGCELLEEYQGSGWWKFYCSDDCGENAGKGILVQSYALKPSLGFCLYMTETPIEYSAKYPFPLTFNGIDKFVDELSYDAVVGG